VAVEVDAVDRLRSGVEYMRSVGDITSAAIFEAILADEEQHIDYLETQLALLDTLGERLYLAQLVEQPDS
jgi:bacterioferritin